MNISVGDVCKIDMAMASKMIGGFGGHQLKILKDVVRQGGGFVDVEEIRGDNAMVSAHDNPMSKIVGGVQVPVRALRQVENPVATRYAKMAKKLVVAALVQKPGVDIGKILGPRFRFVPAISWGSWAVYKFYDRSGSPYDRHDPRALEQGAKRVRREVERALQEENVDFKQVEVRTDGREKHGLDVDVYVIIESM